MLSKNQIYNKTSYTFLGELQLLLFQFSLHHKVDKLFVETDEAVSGENVQDFLLYRGRGSGVNVDQRFQIHSATLEG